VAASSKWLESKAYKMHIRVLLSKYRAYTEWRRLRRHAAQADAMLWKVDGKSIRDLMLLPLSSFKGVFPRNRKRKTKQAGSSSTRSAPGCGSCAMSAWPT